jgi:hemoglobin
MYLTCTISVLLSSVADSGREERNNFSHNNLSQQSSTIFQRISAMQRWVIFTVLVTALLTPALFSQAVNGEKSLYERLGGQPAIEAVANGLVDRILADSRVNKWFVHAASSPENTNAYKKTLASFLCVGVGGPCKYTGRDMVTAHQGRGVTSEAFNAVAEDLSAQLDHLKVPAKEKAEVMQIAASLKPSIVQSTASK